MYFNTLIIMNEDALGYGNRSRKPSGYCKLTMPNRVSCYVQGLRQLPKGQIYRLYLTSKSKQQSVEVGMLQVGANGNKETRWVMTPTSINNTGIKAEEIDGAFIMVSGNDIKGSVVPLVGFSAEPYIWEHLVANNKEVIPIETINQEITHKAAVEMAAITQTPPQLNQVDSASLPQTLAEEKQVDLEPTVQTRTEKQHVDYTPTAQARTREKPVDYAATVQARTQEKAVDDAPIFLDETPSDDPAVPDEVLALKEEVEKLNRTIQESKAIIETLQRQTMRTEESVKRTETIETESPSVKSIDTEPLEVASGINDYLNNFIRKFQTHEEKDQRGYQTENQTESQAKSQAGKQRNGYHEIRNIYENRIPINPFEVQNTGIKWVRITHEDLVSFPSLSDEWTNQPLMMDAHRDYKHFILGRDGSGLTYYLGIPGIFDPNKESPLNIDRIERFSCCSNVPPRVGQAGYWIARL